MFSYIIWIAVFLIIASGIALLCRSQYELHQLTIHPYEITGEKLGKEWNGYKMAVIADLHDNEFGEKNSRLLEQIRKQRVDCVLIAGDLIIAKEWKEKDFSIMENLIKELSGLCPVYYGSGNHEARMQWEQEAYPGWYEEFKNILETYQIPYLCDQTITLKKGNSTITMSGLDLGKEYYLKGKKRKMEKDYIEKKIGKAEKSHFHILLAHNPLYVKEYAEWGADLVFAGHFHGGVMRLPLLGGVVTPQLQFFSHLAKGLVEEKNTKMIVSAGLGTHSINMRINNPPELIIVTLYAAGGKDEAISKTGSV